MQKVYELFMAYAPSLISRYSTQILVIAAPLFLQKSGETIGEISKSLILFYAGSLIFGFIGSRIELKKNIQKILMFSLLIQAITGVFCLFTTKIAWLAIFRFFQGAATAWSRPLAQIWANEYSNNFNLNADEKVLINIFVQLAIGLGMTMGGVVGLWIGLEKIGLSIQMVLMLAPTLILILAVKKNQ